MLQLASVGQAVATKLFSALGGLMSRELSDEPNGDRSVEGFQRSGSRGAGGGRARKTPGLLGSFRLSSWGQPNTTKGDEEPKAAQGRTPLVEL